MKKLLFALALLVGTAAALAQTGSPQPKSSLSTEINTQFPNNTAGQITPQNLRQVTQDLMTSSQQFLGVNAQVGTSYTVQLSDYGQLVTLNNNNPVAVTIPYANTAGFDPFNVYLLNRGSGLVTVTPAAGTIGGNTSLSLGTNQGIHLVSDGLNWQIVCSGPCTAGSAAVSPSNPRTLLTGTPIFYVTTTGSDATGDGSLSRPYKTSVTALFNLIENYDLGATTPVIQYGDGTYDLSVVGGAFWQSTPVGGAQITIQGNIASPGRVILDGGTRTNGQSALFAGPGAGGTIQIQGFQMQNFDRALQCQLNAANISIIGPIIFGPNSNLDMDIEFCGNGGITSGSPATITFIGAQNQLMYVEGTGHADFNQAQIVFATGTTFNSLYDVAFGGMIRIYNNFTGTTTGFQYDISNGGIINFRDNSGNFVDPGSVPGTANSGIVEGGWINDNFGNAPVAISSLILCATQTLGVKAIVNDATTTVFNATITRPGSSSGGGGGLIAPVYCGAGTWHIG